MVQKKSLEEKVTKIFPFTKSIFVIISDPRIKFVLNLLKIINGVGLALAVFGVIFYSLGYSFLYGYYFGGENSLSISTLDMLINPVPFNQISVLSISAVLSAGIVLIILVTKGSIKLFSDLKAKRGSEVVIVSFGFVVIMFVLLTGLHIGLSIFFVSGLTDLMDKAKAFIVVWLGPLIIALTILVFLRLSTKPITGFTGILYGMVILYLSIKYLNIEKDYLGLSFLIMVTFSIFMTFFEEKMLYSRIYRIVIFFPYPTFVLIVLNNVSGLLVSDIWLFIISILLSIVIPNMYKNKVDELKKDNNNDPFIKVLDIFTNRWWGLSTFIVAILYIGVAITTLVTNAGEHVRLNTPTRSMVTIEDVKSNIKVKGKIVGKKNDTIYISNEDWKLEIIKSNPIRTCCETNIPLKKPGEKKEE